MACWLPVLVASAGRQSFPVSSVKLCHPCQGPSHLQDVKHRHSTASDAGQSCSSSEGQPCCKTHKGRAAPDLPPGCLHKGSSGARCLPRNSHTPAVPLGSVSAGACAGIRSAWTPGTITNLNAVMRRLDTAQSSEPPRQARAEPPALRRPTDKHSQAAAAGTRPTRRLCRTRVHPRPA